MDLKTKHPFSKSPTAITVTATALSSETRKFARFLGLPPLAACITKFRLHFSKSITANYSL
uniref:Uncharacterized protein n=1 Tax=Ciona intestinalis TaxID=7719 RepID=H2Y2I4_CIOIN